MPAIPANEIRLIVHVGLMLFLGLLAGEITARFRIPRVTGYLLAGLLMSGSVSGLVDGGELRSFDLIAQLALGLIMFNIGGEFAASHVRRFGRKLLTVAACEMGLTWLLVGGGIWALSRDGALAVIVGFIAMATAPATTLMVVKEYESEGPLTSNLIALVGINNFLCLMLFPFLLFALMDGDVQFHLPFIEVGKSLLLGVVLGLALSFFEEHTHSPKQQVVLGFCSIALVVGLAYAWNSSGMMSALVMGIVKVNSSMRGQVLFERIDSAAYPFYVLFFVVAGANLNLKTLLYAGALGVIYIIGRASAKIVGAACGAHVAGFSSDLKGYLGPAMISHAGVAIGLAMAVGRLDSISGNVAQAIVLGSVVVYELIGPITVRFALVRCGEVKMISLLSHVPGHSSVDNLEKVLYQIRRSLGFSIGGYGRGRRDITAKHIMRSNVETVRDNTRFDELLKIISHARYDLVPVVDTRGNYIGNISFPRIRDVIFDRAVADLVIARDLLDYDAAYVTPEEPLGSILQKFQALKDEVGNLPVVAEGEDSRVIGMIRQRDAVDVFWRLRSEEKKNRSG